MADQRLPLYKTETLLWTMSDKQNVFSGSGSINKLGRILKQVKPTKVFLVTGGDSYAKCGAKTALDRILKNYHQVVFDDFEPNPKLKDIKKGLTAFIQARPDIVIAVGGGSVIDVAKAINTLAVNRGDPEDYIRGGRMIQNPGKPMVVIPTTAGSGSESTHFAVVYIDKNKYSLAHHSILPSFVILDPRLTYDLPSRLTAISGMDALTQGVEAYWSINSTPLAKRYASQAIKLILNNLERVVKQPDPQSRLAMIKGANLAGRAINIANTTACHAVSYPLTAFFNVPHGQGVGLTLSEFIKYNSRINPEDVLDKRGIGYVKKTLLNLYHLLNSENAKQTAMIIDRLMENIGLKARLSKLGVLTEHDIKIIIDDALSSSRMRNNPRLITHESLYQILTRML